MASHGGVPAACAQHDADCHSLGVSRSWHTRIHRWGKDKGGGSLTLTPLGRGPKLGFYVTAASINQNCKYIAESEATSERNINTSMPPLVRGRTQKGPSALSSKSPCIVLQPKVLGPEVSATHTLSTVTSVLSYHHCMQHITLWTAGFALLHCYVVRLEDWGKRRRECTQPRRTALQQLNFTC